MTSGACRKIAFSPVAPPGILAEAEVSIPARFRQRAEADPQRTAIVGSHWQPTYAELDALTNQLAHAVISSGGASGGRVALLTRHDAPLIAAALATLKAGRVVVVLNPADPAARLKQILDDAAPDCLLTDTANEELARQIAEKNQAIIRFGEQGTYSTQAPFVEIAPHALAWLIYTSGSTGRPKGVMQSHRNIVHNVLRFSQGMNLTPDDRFVLLSSPGGGQGVSTIWCALLNSAALLPFPIAEKGANALKKWLKENRTTIYISSPSVFGNLAKCLEDADSFPAIRLVRFGADTATANHLAVFKKHFSRRCILLNCLSSSETGNIAQQPFTLADDVAENRLPVGPEVTGMKVRFMDERGGEVRPGETGEIFVQSHYLSPGYWRNELLTAERFCAADEAGGLRVYRSGDLGRRLPDGSLIFVGRKDARVKIHGYRVELSEIRDALEKLPPVASAFVTARTLSDGDNQLLAYLLLRPGAGFSPDQLRRGLRQTLPAHMTPAHFIVLEKFPLTAHGKIDRNALPPPVEMRKKLPRRERPRDLVESRLAKIWESVLGVAPIARQDDFFYLGGTSLQSVEILLHIEQAFGASLPPSILIEHGTVEKLAAVIAGNVVIRSLSPLIALRQEGAGRPFFLIHSGQGDVTSYGPLARRLSGRPVYGLQSIGLNGEAWPCLSIPAMAARYLQEITTEDPTGPYLLGGTCMGGLVAFEMAQMLVRQGKKVALLALLDVPVPCKPWEEDSMKERLFAPFRNPVRDSFRILRWRALRAAGLGQEARRLPAYRRFVANMNSRANRRYSLGFYPGPITLFMTVDTVFPGEDRRLIVRRYAEESKIISLPGNRAGLFVPPVVDELAQQLQICLESAVKTGGGR
jgi:amino acid adenylation domain-containing protein